MPILQTETGYIYKKNKKQTKAPAGIKRLCIFVVAMATCFASFYVFSLFNITSFLGLNKYKVFSEKTYYAVCVAEGQTFVEVSNVVSPLKNYGGAGYVLKQNKKYYVVASIYQTEADAQKVCDNISGEFEASVTKIKLDSLVLSSDYTSEQISALKTSLDLVNRTFEKLYEVCVSFDKGEILEAEAKQKLQVFRETCQLEKENLSNTFKDNCDNIVTNVKIFQSEIVASLSALSLSSNFSVDTKYTMASVLNSFLSLENNVTK